MKAVIYAGIPYNVTVLDIPKPSIIDPTDAIVRITMSSICGSDMHIFHGVSGGVPPWGMGHEAVGYISEIRDAVSSLSVGDYVVIPDSESCGRLELIEEPPTYFGFGLSNITSGLQAEYTRVRYADESLIPIPLTPETTNSSVEMDYITLSDVFATAWAAVEFSGFQPGDTVAVFGSGPVGLLAAYSAVLRGASNVYIVDCIEQRLDLASKIGAIPINFLKTDPVAQILEFEPGGVIRSVKCVGMEAKNVDLSTDFGITLRQMVSATHINGGLGYVGVYMAQENSTGAPYGSSIKPNITFPMSEFWTKGLSFKAGIIDPKAFAPTLFNLVASGRAHPGFVGSSLIDIDDVPSYYRRADNKEEIKVFIRFP